ncbi:MAG: sugar-binding protein, partial [Candidatus Saccharibacteria bacterium]
IVNLFILVPILQYDIFSFVTTMIHTVYKGFYLLVFFTFIGITGAMAAQSDTVRVQQATVLPIFDGDGSDPCWNASGVAWQPIDQVWMPWKGTVPSAADFTGRFKVIWNESENVLLFLVDIEDDSFIDGYDFASNGPFGYPNYDVVEFFLDEDRSKGAHVFDNGSENAQNAFSYHITVNAPADGQTTHQFSVEDLDGVNWSNSWVVNYASHFPQFSMKKSGNHYTYEFSLKVYNDSYPTQQRNGSTTSDIENARVKLKAGKVMGGTMAYCDNDTNDGKRDHFFGSTPGKEYTANFGFSGTQNSISTENGQKIFNTCWMSANDYGVFKLMGSAVTSNISIDNKSQKVIISQNNTNSDLNVIITNTQPAKTAIDIYNFSGQKVAGFQDTVSGSSYQGTFSIQSLKTGIYVVRISVGKDVYVHKITKQ